MGRILVLNSLLRPCYFKFKYNGVRTFLSHAYMCEEAWQKRLENPILKNIQMDKHFVETEKKFGRKELANGIDVDLFANNVQRDSELEELEHLLYRFRRTKRSVEMMDSTTYATIRVFLKFKQYESLLRILHAREDYGIFPDFFSYNILMDTFLNEKLYKEACEIAVLMMLQEDFGNKLSRLLGLYSCQIFLNEGELESWNLVEEATKDDETKDADDEEEVTLVRIPFLRNPFFDDHFDIVNPKHLIGKTFYLIGREMDDIIGRTYEILGLVMYEKFNKATQVLESFSKLNQPILISEGVEKILQELSSVSDSKEESVLKSQEELKENLQKLKLEKKLSDGNMIVILEEKLKDIKSLELEDIEMQKKMFLEWENLRNIALEKQFQDIDKQKRLKVIEEKKEYLYWKEKLLFFFENEQKNLENMHEIEEMVANMKSKKSVVDTYEPPEIIKKPIPRPSVYEKLAKVRKL